MISNINSFIIYLLSCTIALKESTADTTESDNVLLLREPPLKPLTAARTIEQEYTISMLWRNIP